MCVCVLTTCCIKDLDLDTKGVLAAVGHVEETVLVLLLVVQLSHGQTVPQRQTTVVITHLDSSTNSETVQSENDPELVLTWTEGRFCPQTGRWLSLTAAGSVS